MKQHHQAIIECMKAGGYFQRIMEGGSELDRVKDYLLAFSGEKTFKPQHPMQRPTYPVFPELRNIPFHQVSDFVGASQLEESYEIIRGEAELLFEQDYLSYHPRGIKNTPEAEIKKAIGR